MRLLGLDLGTTNVKAILADESARIVGRGSVPIALQTDETGGAEQDLEEIWQAAKRALRQAIAGGNPRDIAALGVSSQGGAMQWLDANRRPAGRVISWLDGRGRAWDDANDRRLGRDWFAPRTGHRGSGLAIGQIQRRQRQGSILASGDVHTGAPGDHGPTAVWGADFSPQEREEGTVLRTEVRAPVVPRFLERTSFHVGFVGDLVVERLCGTPAHDITSAAMTLLCNPRQRGYDPEVLALVGVEPTRLPRICRADQPAGGLLPSVAEELGLAPGTPVSPAVHDQYAAALGVGAILPGQVLFGTGTAWVLVAMTPRWVPPVTEDAFVAPHVVDDVFGQLLALRNGGSSVSWALRMIGREHCDDRIEGFLARVPAGCDGLRCAPFLTATAPAGLPPGTSGSLAGLRLSHGPEHLVRSVIEGLAFELRRHLQLLDRAGLASRQILMCGAAAAGRVTPQIIADVTGVPVTCAAQGEGSLLGALVIARKLVRPGESWASASEAIRPAGRSLTPGPDQAVYAAGFQDYMSRLAPPTLPSNV